MTVSSVAHIQVSNHFQNQCAYMSEEIKEYESVQTRILKKKKEKKSSIENRELDLSFFP